MQWEDLSRYFQGNYEYSHKTRRDGKLWFKPPRWFKAMRRQEERTKVAQLMREGKFEQILPDKKGDEWEWS